MIIKKPFFGTATLFLIYIFLILGYCWRYAPYGLENNDGGFIVGLSYQFSQGLVPYKQILYARPPMSIIMHSVYFFNPFNVAPILSSRIFFFFQVGIYSALASLIFSRWFFLKNHQLLLIACASFLLNVNNFPPMAWHTVDGIFFSVFAIYFSSKTGDRSLFANAFFAFLFALLAALSKQPFYIMPIIASVLLLVEFSFRKLFCVILSGLLSSVLILLALRSILQIDEMIFSITAQTNIQDLLSAGIIDYIRDWFSLRHAFAAAPLSMLIMYWSFFRNSPHQINTNPHGQILVIFSVLIFLTSLLLEFSLSNERTTIASYVDTIFTVTALISAWNSIKTRNKSWFGLSALHAISWASSISWGGLSVFLFSSPSVFVVALVLRDTLHGHKINHALSMAVIVYLIILFRIGNNFLYSLEGPVKLSDNTISMGGKFPAFHGIYATKEQELVYRELSFLTKNIDGEFIIVPNWPLCGLAFPNCAKIGAVWLLNAEVGHFEEVVKKRLLELNYIFLFKGARPAPQENGKFGSKLTIWIANNWQPIHVNSTYFDVYQNPQKMHKNKFNELRNYKYAP